MRWGNRKTIHLQGHDYSGRGYYFVTLVSHDRECLFGQVVDGRMFLNQIGHLVEDEWRRSPDFRAELGLDRWIVMPNHLHGVVIIRPRRCRGAWRAPCPGQSQLHDNPMGIQSESLASFIAGFKASTMSKINRLRNTPGAPVWQRNYHEHIIDNADELQRCRQYIRDNPSHWDEDRNKSS